jgi:transposase
MVLEHQNEHDSQWSTILSIAGKLGCSTETLRKWIRQVELDQGIRPGLTTEERQRLKELERESRELKRANEILRKASAYFAQAVSTGIQLSPSVGTEIPHPMVMSSAPRRG